MPEAPDEANISELQKLVDEDSDGESSEDDWKVEGRKLSEDLAKANESDPELSDVEEEKEELALEVKDEIKTRLLASTLLLIFSEVTDELIGKISRSVISKGKVLDGEKRQKKVAKVRHRCSNRL